MVKGFAQETPVPVREVPPEESQLPPDSVLIIKPEDQRPRAELQQPLDTVERDSVAQDSVKRKKSGLEYQVDSYAKDYKILNRKENTMEMYNEAYVIYGNTKINAGRIIIDFNTGNVKAYGIVDSTGTYTQAPVFKQGNNVVEPDSIIFNKDTKKALIYNSVTQQGEFNVFAPKTKKENDSVFFMEDVRFTTAKDPKNPEYYFRASKIKFVPKKKIITSSVQMVIADVPTPVWVPFAFFPLTDERQSGFIIPSFGQRNRQGYALQNGGYYFAINDYLDLTVLGDYFTNGSWGTRVETNYRNRYKFNGNLRFSYENQIQSQRGFSDYSRRTNYNINWQHAQDPKNNPNSRFNANVNLGSSQFFRQSFNQLNQSATLVNSFNSSVSYSKTFEGEPQINFTVSATHSQNTNTNEINMTLPTFQGSISRVFPFAPKNGAKKGIIQNINLQYNVRGENRFTTTDEDFFTSRMFERGLQGLKHDIPITTNFKIAKYFSMSVGGNFSENWVFQTFDQTQFRNEEGVLEVRRDTVQGFDAYRTYNFNASLGTTIYGNWENSNKEAKIQAIRHIIRPAISYNVNPAFDQYYDVLLDENGVRLSEEEIFYSRFQNTLFGAPGRNFSSSLGLSIQNNVEAKIRDTTATEPRKIALIKSLGLTTNYNLAGDSLRLSPINLNGLIPVTEKLDLNLNATLDPYALNNQNQRVDRWNINNGGSLFRLTNFGARFGFNLSNEDFESGVEEEPDKKQYEHRIEDEGFRNGGRDDDLFGQAGDIGNQNYYEDEEPEEQNVNIEESLYRFKIPWRLNIAYAMNYTNAQRQDMISNNSIMLSGDIELSPRWSIGGNTGYDFVDNGITFTTLRFQRDLESWRLSFNWTPIGPRQSWFFFIGIKSGALADVKYEQNSPPVVDF